MEKSVKVPNKLYKKIKTLVKESPEFKSVEQFVKFVLEEVLKEEEPEKKKKEKVYSDEEEEEIKDRLRALGYL